MYIIYIYIYIYICVYVLIAIDNYGYDYSDEGHQAPVLRHLGLSFYVYVSLA